MENDCFYIGMINIILTWLSAFAEVIFRDLSMNECFKLLYLTTILRWYVPIIWKLVKYIAVIL